MAEVKWFLGSQCQFRRLGWIADPLNLLEEIIGMFVEPDCEFVDGEDNEVFRHQFISFDAEGLFKELLKYSEPGNTRDCIRQKGVCVHGLDSH